MSELMYHPPSEAIETAWIRGKDYAKLYQQSLDDPDGGYANVSLFKCVETNRCPQHSGLLKPSLSSPGIRNGILVQSASQLDIFDSWYLVPCLMILVTCYCFLPMIMQVQPGHIQGPCQHHMV